MLNEVGFSLRDGPESFQEHYLIQDGPLQVKQVDGWFFVYRENDLLMQVSVDSVVYVRYGYVQDDIQPEVF